MFDQQLRAGYEDQSWIPAPREAAGEMESQLSLRGNAWARPQGRGLAFGDSGFVPPRHLEGAGLSFPRGSEAHSLPLSRAALEPQFSLSLLYLTPKIPLDSPFPTAPFGIAATGISWRVLLLP